MDKDIRAQALPQLAKSFSPAHNGPGAKIHRERSAGLELLVIESAPITELHLTLIPKPGETPGGLITRLAHVLAEWNAAMVQQLVFGSLAAQSPTLIALKQTFGRAALPLTWVEGASCTGSPLAGMQVHAVAGAAVQIEPHANGTVASCWDGATARHCVLNGLGPTRLAPSPSVQSAETLENLQAALAHAGMSMKDVARTWFFLDDILSWYGDFNRVRNDFFARCELRAGSVPASTGVSGRNPSGAALTAATWAIRPNDHGAQLVQVVSSPLQCPAPAYGSAFSRAVEVQSAGFRQVLVSGTASIAPGGRTEYVGDVRKQIDLSMQVVAAILASRQMTFADVSRATAYFKSPADVAAWEDWRARHEQRTMPVVCAACDICRDDLLFEIELDAIRANSNS